MVPEHTEGSVVVVGAGPVGKTAALLLASYGIGTVVIEKGDGLSDEPKAISVDDETLRIYQQAGIVEDVLRIIVPGIGTQYFDSEGEPLFLGGSPRPGRFGYPFKNPFSQPELEQVLHAALTREPLVTYLTGHEVRELHQSPREVTVRVAASDGSEFDVSAAFLIGADGGRSTVRAQAGIPMTGRSYPDAWLVVDTTNDPHDERYGLHYGDPRRPHVIVPGLDGRCRYEFPVTPGECEAGAEPPLELIQQLLKPYRSISADEIDRAVVYRFHALNSTQYRVGRVFVAGDAAHMMPPFAGQGLNSGMRDVFNLSWKIAHVLAGTMADSALDSYDSERRPQAGLVVAFSERLGRVVMTENSRLAHARDRIVRSHLADPDGLRYFQAMGFRPPLTLRQGLLVAGEGPVGDALPQPRVFDLTAGALVPLDVPLGGDWAIVGVQVDAAGWADAAQVAAVTGAQRVHVDLDGRNPRSLPVDRIIADVDGTLADALRARSGRFLLVRPDRVLAASWAPGEQEQIIAAVTPWFTSASSDGADQAAEAVATARGAGTARAEGTS
ncbi:FAD-dependent monooxygenase [Microbacterium sp. NPDC091313]